MNKLQEYILEHRVVAGILVFIILLLSAIIFYIYKSRTYLTAEFKDLRPFRYPVPVYYKGFKIGKAEHVRPNRDYTSSVMTIVLFPRDLHLPTNMQAKFKIEKRRNKDYDFIELIYPDSPSIYYLKDGDRLSGKTSIDVRDFLANQNPETLEGIKDNLAKAVENLNVTLSVLGDLFGSLNQIVLESKPNILRAANNLAETTENIRQSSYKINNALKQEQLDNTINNVDLSSNNAQETTRSIQKITNDIDGITKNINKMMPQVDCIISETYSITKNVNDITAGVSNTMQQNMGGMRLLFGKPIKCFGTSACRRGCRR